MNQSTRTFVFVGAAIVCVGLAFATHSNYKPVDLDDFSDVGTEFYKDFENPNDATGLRVASFNEDSSQTDVFSVEFKNGLWRIPSHHDYPADGEEQLAKTAASMVGVKRQAMIERTKAAHKRYNLLDPLDKDVTGTEGRGDRITLYKDGEELVDFIVGNKLDDQENVYYVRRADEDRFYTADLGDFEITTKFADWIEKDILDINRNDVNELVINRYQIDESRGELVQGDRTRLHRESSTADWQIEELNAETEEVETSNINSLLLALDDLAIVGVRKKPPGISADLKAEEGVSITRLDMLDLQDKGFFIDPRQGRILSNEGEVLVGTDKGILYALRFGEEFSGSDVDIEVGGGKPSESDESAEEEKPVDEEKAEGDEEKSDEESEDDEDDSLAKSRYLFVTAQFDEELLGEKPIPPVKPEPPAETETADEEATEEKKADAEGDEAKEEEKPDPQKEYEEALQRYEEEQEVYEIKLKEYEENIEKGQERVAELNKRFADWYYVISSDVFDRMKLDRADLVKEKEKPEEEAAAEGSAPPVTVPATEKATEPPNAEKTEDPKAAPAEIEEAPKGPTDEKEEAAEAKESSDEEATPASTKEEAKPAEKPESPEN